MSLAHLFDALRAAESRELYRSISAVPANRIHCFSRDTLISDVGNEKLMKVVDYSVSDTAVGRGSRITENLRGASGRVTVNSHGAELAGCEGHRVFALDVRCEERNDATVEEQPARDALRRGDLS